MTSHKSNIYVEHSDAFCWEFMEIIRVTQQGSHALLHNLCIVIHVTMVSKGVYDKVHCW